MLCCFWMMLGIPLFSQIDCTVRNKSFQAGEKCDYQIYYNWGALWMSAGEATFSCELTKLNNIDAFHFIGTGATYPKYDWFFMVRDRYESYADTTKLKPLRFKRLVHEGPTNMVDDYVFNFSKKEVYSYSKKNRKDSRLDSVKTSECTNDVMTAIFYARSLDFSKYKLRDTIPITFVLDGEVFPSYIRYLGKEVIHSDVLGNVRCIKFKPKLIEGTLFKGGEGMTVWVTDDANRMPVYVETPIIVGSVKVYLKSYTGLKYKLNCQVENKTAPSK